MITKYFSKVTVAFNPLVVASKPARVFLASIPPSARGNSIDVTQKIIGANDKPLISVTYKDGNQISLDPTAGTTTEVAETFDRYSRILKLKQDVAED